MSNKIEIIKELINEELNDMFCQLCVDYNIPDEVADKYIDTFNKHINIIDND